MRGKVAGHRSVRTRQIRCRLQVAAAVRAEPDEPRGAVVAYAEATATAAASAKDGTRRPVAASVTAHACSV
jgi:hypothetical protein